MTRVQISFKGVTKLILHNVRLADPDDPISREVAKLAGKRKKTPEDRKEIARLEWYGGLYVFDGIAGPAMPTANLKRCLTEAGKVTRKGRAVMRGVVFAELAVPIVYDGPRDLDKLYLLEAHQHRQVVGIQQSKTVRMRPCFPQWGVVADALLQESLLDIDDLAEIVSAAGTIEGLADARALGYGRFEGQVAKVD